MDERSFDRLARSLTHSRRRTLVALLLGGLGSRLAGSAPVAATCHVVGERCQIKTDYCAGSRCDNGRCRCRAGMTACGKRCHDLESDLGHCGACGNACRPDQACCGGRCVNLATDPDHCGECERRCNQICNEMKDGTVVCVGERCCDGGQCVVETTSNPDHCGACHRSCAAGETCCGSECIDLQSDADHCGACFQDCPEFMTCLSGQCVVKSRRGEIGPTFGAGLQTRSATASHPHRPDSSLKRKEYSMDARAFDVLTRSFVASRRRTIAVLVAGALGAWRGGRQKEAAAACGRVGYVCPVATKCCAGALCVDDLCRCRKGLKTCNGTCYDLASDESNCGACGVACEPNQVCHEGRCRRDEPL